MSLRLASTKALPRIRASSRPSSWRLPWPRAFPQAARLSTITQSNINARNQARNISSLKFSSGDRGPNIKGFTSAEDPNNWLVSSDRPRSIIISHPESKRQVVLNHHALRDACECDRCVDPHSGQKNFGTTDIPDDISIQNCERLEDASLQVIWRNDFLSPGQPHKSVYPAHIVRQWFTKNRETFPKLPVPILWDKTIFKASPSMVKYDDWVSGGPGFHTALAQLWRYGLVFIDGVPKSEDSVVTLANKVGHVYETFYGRTWDVRSKPQAENVAYTNSFLGLHQDLLYIRDPPRLQFLHCLENTCEGGDSIFSDSHRAAMLMEFGPSDQFRALSNLSLRYHYKKDGHFYEKLRKVIDKENNDVWWSPPFQSPDQPTGKTAGASAAYEIWRRAAKKFRELLEDERWLYEYKLKPGQCVVFDNLRVLHGRRAFDTSTGSRWLKGTYVSRDEWKSKALTLAQEITASSKEEGIPSLPSQVKTLYNSHNPWGYIRKPVIKDAKRAPKKDLKVDASAGPSQE